MKFKTAILIGIFAFPFIGKAVDPTVTADSSNNWLPALRNGHAPNLPANTTMGGSPITGVSDGDKGDITVSGSGATWTIDAKTISLAKMADMATASFLGRNTAGTSSPEVLSISTVKTMLGIAGTFGTAAYVNTGTTSGTVPLLGTGGHLANATMPLGAQLYDNAGTPKLAADFGAGKLYSNDGTTVVVDLLGAAFHGSLFGSLTASDSSPVVSADDRAALSPNGTVLVDWSGNALLKFFPAGTYAAINSDGELLISKILDGSVSYSDSYVIDVGARQLIANDGSTVALDWSDPAEVSIGGGSIIAHSGDFAEFPNGFGSNFFLDNHSGTAGAYIDGTVGWRWMSTDNNTYFDNSGFHGDGSGVTNVTPKVGSIGSVIAGTKTATGTATTTFTVTIGVTMANTTYKVTTEGDNALSSAVHYVNNKTTTSFDIVYLAGLTGAVSVDWIVSP